MNDLDLGQTIRGFAAGQRLFERYELKEILGRGGMGVVWRAFDEQLECDIALKFLPELLVLDKAAMDDLKRETKRSRELTHHHIVRIYDFVQDKQSACISMEYVDGQTLSALRVEKANKVFDAHQLDPLIEQACDALEYAHVKARIVHRDFKPSNLMLNSRGEVKVTDFGIARSMSDSVSMLSLRTSGTLVYMSPQQLGGQRPSPLDDVYSLGATIYELLTSKPPFYSGDVSDQIKHTIPVSMQERRDELEITGTEIPKVWEETVAACLAKDPAPRPRSAREAAQRLGLSVPQYGPTKPQVGTTDRNRASSRVAGVSPAKSRQRKDMFIGAVTIIALIGAAFGWYFGMYLPRGRSRKTEANASAAPLGPTAAVPAESNFNFATAARFAGAWKGQMKIRAIDCDIALTVKDDATGLLQESQRAGQPAQKHPHPTTIKGETLQWVEGDLNNVRWTLTPNADGRTAVAKTNTDGVENTAIFSHAQQAPATNARGAASINTEPAGATVTLGDETLKSPASFSNVTAGNLSLKVRLDNYESVEQEIEIKGGEIANPGVIKLVRSKGSAQIDTTPEGIEFDLEDADGKHHTGKTAATLIDLPAGPAKITYKSHASPPHSESAVIAAHHSSALTWKVEARPRPNPVPMSASPTTGPISESPAALQPKSFAGVWSGKWKWWDEAGKGGGAETLKINADMKTGTDTVTKQWTTGNADTHDVSYPVRIRLLSPTKISVSNDAVGNSIVAGEYVLSLSPDGEVLSGSYSYKGRSYIVHSSSTLRRIK